MKNFTSSALAEALEYETCITSPLFIVRHTCFDRIPAALMLIVHHRPAAHGQWHGSHELASSHHDQSEKLLHVRLCRWYPLLLLVASRYIHSMVGRKTLDVLRKGTKDLYALNTQYCRRSDTASPPSPFSHLKNSSQAWPVYAKEKSDNLPVISSSETTRLLRFDCSKKSALTDKRRPQ